MSSSLRLWGTCVCAALVLLCLSACGRARAAPSQALTLGENEFRLEIDGVTAGIFKEVDGLSIEQEVVEYQDGQDPLLRKRPGRVKYGDITLKRGYFLGSTLNDWIEEARLGRSIRKNISISLHNKGDDTALRRWNCFECFPKSWKVASLDGKGNDVLTEEMTIVIEYFEEA